MNYIKILLSIILVSVFCCGAAAQPAYSLQQLLDSALQRNISIRNAIRAVESSSLQRKEAFTNYFPTISGTAMTFAANREMAKMDIDPSEFITPELGASLAQSLPAEALAALSSPMTMTMMKNGTIAGINAVLPVFTGGQIINGNRLAKVAEQASRLQLQLTRNDVERQLTSYFYQLVTLQEKQHTLDAVDSLLTSLAADAQTAVDAGVALRNDLLQVQLRQNDIASQRLKLTNGIQLLQMLIAQFCGLSSSHFQLTAHNPSTPLPRSAQRDAFPRKNRGGVGGGAPSLPEYQLLQANVRAATLQRRMETGKHMPSLAVGAGYNYHNILDNDRHFGMIFATLSLPVTEWWGGSMAIRRKRIAEQQAREQLDDTSRQLLIRQQKAANDLNEAKNQIQIAQQSIQQAQENLRIQRDTYAAGTSTMSDLLQAQLLLQQAMDNHTEAIAQHANAQLEYRLSAAEQ